MRKVIIRIPPNIVNLNRDNVMRFVMNMQSRPTVYGPDACSGVWLRSRRLGTRSFPVELRFPNISTLSVTVGEC